MKLLFVFTNVMILGVSGDESEAEPINGEVK